MKIRDMDTETWRCGHGDLEKWRHENTLEFCRISQNSAKLRQIPPFGILRKLIPIPTEVRKYICTEVKMSGGVEGPIVPSTIRVYF